MSLKSMSVAASIALLSVGLSGGAHAQQSDMTFFITSVGNGKGADFGGLAGADKHCQKLAAAVGAGKHKWRAYLSTSGSNAVNARDRIGKGPWQNAKGAVIARNVEELHGNNNLDQQTALNEKGQIVNGRPQRPNNQHDILTGSKPDGTAIGGSDDRTCGNWTSSGEGHAMVGHHDRMGLRDDAPSKSWNSSHPSRGCSLAALKKSGGAGLIYCFAAN